MICMKLSILQGLEYPQVYHNNTSSNGSPFFGWGNWLSEGAFVEFHTAEWWVETENWSLCFNIHTISALPEVSWLGSQSPGTRGDTLATTLWGRCGEKRLPDKMLLPCVHFKQSSSAFNFYLLCTLKIITQENGVHYLKVILQDVAL